MIIYLSGKITGDPDYRNKFRKAEKSLKAMGHKVYNPCVIPDIFDWNAFIDIDLTILQYCNAIFMLDDWKESKGAQAEREEAMRLDLFIFDKDHLPPAVILEKTENEIEAEETRELKKLVKELVKRFSPDFDVLEEVNYILPEKILQDIAQNIKARRFTDYSIRFMKKTYGVTTGDALRIKKYLVTKKEFINDI